MRVRLRLRRADAIHGVCRNLRVFRANHFWHPSGSARIPLRQIRRRGQSDSCRGRACQVHFKGDDHVDDGVIGQRDLLFGAAWVWPGEHRGGQQRTLAGAGPGHHQRAQDALGRRDPECDTAHRRWPPCRDQPARAGGERGKLAGPDRRFVRAEADRQPHGIHGDRFGGQRRSADGSILFDGLHGAGSVLPDRLGVRTAPFRDGQRRLRAGDRRRDRRRSEDDRPPGRDQRILGYVQSYKTSGSGAAGSRGRRSGAATRWSTSSPGSCRSGRACARC